MIFNSIQINQTGEVPTKRKNKAYAVIKNEMEERERAKKRASKNAVCFFILMTMTVFVVILIEFDK